MIINTYHSTFIFKKEDCSSAPTIPPEEEGRTNIFVTEGDQVGVTQSKNLHATQISFPLK